jgi:hypothetical protein
LGAVRLISALVLAQANNHQAFGVRHIVLASALVGITLSVAACGGGAKGRTVAEKPFCGSSTEGKLGAYEGELSPYWNSPRKLKLLTNATLTVVARRRARDLCAWERVDDLRLIWERNSMRPRFKRANAAAEVARLRQFERKQFPSGPP